MKNKLTYKHFTLLFVILLSVSVGVYVTLLYVYDPLQFWHKPYFRDTTFSRDMRLQNVGIIKHYDFDSYIIGNSMVEFVPIKKLDSITKQNWVNLMMYGSKLHDRAIVMDYLFKYKQPKEIIYSLDFEAFTGFKEMDSINDFAFAYSDNFFNILKFYSAPNYLKCAIKFSKTESCVGVKRELHNLNASLVEMEFLAKKFGGFYKWIKYEDKRIQPVMDSLREFMALDSSNIKSTNLDSKNTESKNIESNNLNSKITDKLTEERERERERERTKRHNTESYNLNDYKEYIDKYLLAFLRQKSKTTFHLVIAPYSRLYWHTLGRGKLSLWQDILRYIVESSKDLQNVRIYGFDLSPYLDDIANYTDSTHYNVDMHETFGNAIINHTHIIDSKNIESYLTEMKEKTQNYDLTPLLRDMQNMQGQDLAY